MIEAKVTHELTKYLDPSQKYIKQLFSYLWQEKSTKISSYYTFELSSERDRFYSINLGKVELSSSLNIDNLIDRWNKQFDETNLLLSQPFDIKSAGKISRPQRYDLQNYIENLEYVAIGNIQNNQFPTELQKKETSCFLP